MCKKHQCNVRGHTGTRSQIYNEIADGKVQNSRFLFDLTWNAPVTLFIVALVIYVNVLLVGGKLIASYREGKY